MKNRSVIPGLVLVFVTGVAIAQETSNDQEYRAELLRDVEARISEIVRVNDAIKETMAGMSAAVEAGDADAYLQFIEREDPVFWTEQQAWARDLYRQIPANFKLSVQGIKIGEYGRLPRPGAARQYPIMASWRLNDGADREVEFPARFVHRDGKWLYAGRAWNTLETEGIRVRYADGLQDAARRVIDDLPEIIDHVHEGFELERDPERVQEVKLYGSMRELQFSIYPSYVESLGGWNEPGESIKILTRANARGRQLKSLLAHEYGHVASFLLGDKIVDAPWWVLEGVAELAAEDVGMSWRATDRMIRRLAGEDGLVEWERMADFHNVDRGVIRMAYVQGHHIMGYVSQRFGRSGRNAWLRAMAGGLGLDDATREAFDISFDELDRQWRASLVGDKATGESGL